MNYQIFILRRAAKELASIPHGDYERVRDSIARLASEPRPSGCTKLTGRAGWRIRVGNFRVLYEIDDSRREVVVFHVGHRRDVYR